MSTASIRFFYEPMRSLAFGSIGAAYMSIGTAIDHPARLYELYNLTNADLLFSIDGVENHFPLAANSFKIVDIVSNKSSADGWYIGQGTSFYAKELLAAPTTGSVYLTIAYGN